MVLSQWVVYDHPTDYPQCWVARLWTIDPHKVEPSGTVILADTLDAVRAEIAVRDPGVVMLTRSPDDDPCIAEVWF